MNLETPGSSATSERAAPHSFRPTLRRIAYAILALEVACLMGLFGCNSCQRRPAYRQGYACLNQTCAAAATFFGGTPGGDPILGFQTSVFLPKASGLAGGTATNLTGQVAGGFLKSSLALNAGPSNAFVEAGYVIQGGVNFDECGQGGNFYFLAEYANSTLAVRCLAPIPAQDFGNYVNLQILNVFNSGSAPTFLVKIGNRGTNLQPCPETSPCVEPLWMPGGTNFGSAAYGLTLTGGRRFSPTARCSSTTPIKTRPAPIISTTKRSTARRALTTRLWDRGSTGPHNRFRPTAAPFTPSAARSPRSFPKC